MCPEWIELPPGRDKARSKHTSPAGGRGREQAREPASHAAHAPLGAPSPPSVVRLSALCFGQGALQRMGRVPLLSLPCPSSTWRCLLHISHCHLNQPVPPQLHAHTHTRTHAHTKTPRDPVHLAGAKAATRCQWPSGPASGWLLGYSSLILVAGSVSHHYGPGKPIRSSGCRINNGKTKSAVFQAKAAPGLTGSSPLQQEHSAGWPRSAQLPGATHVRPPHAVSLPSLLRSRCRTRPDPAKVRPELCVHCRIQVRFSSMGHSEPRWASCLLKAGHFSKPTVAGALTGKRVRGWPWV